MLAQWTTSVMGRSTMPGDGPDWSNVLVPATDADVTLQFRGDPRINNLRISHQPNFLAYWKLIGQFSLADTVGTAVVPLSRLRAPITFVVNDYDDWRDERLRRAEFPSLRSEARQPTYLNLSPRPGTPRHRIYYHLGGIPEGYSRHLQSQVEGYLAGMRELLPRSQRARFWRVTTAIVLDVIAIVDTSQDWREFAIRYILMVLDWMGISRVQVVSGYESFQRSQPEIRRLIEEVLSIIPDYPAASLVWMECASCHSRSEAPASLSTGNCSQCGNAWDGQRDSLIPKIILDNLLDDVLYPQSMSFCHIGGFSHIVESHLFRARLGLRSPNVDVVSDQGTRSDHMFSHIARSAAARTVDKVDLRTVRDTYDHARSGSFSSLYYLIGDAFGGG